MDVLRGCAAQPIQLAVFAPLAGAQTGAADAARAAAVSRRKTVVRAVRYSPAEWRRVEERAHACGMPPATFVRLAALGVRVYARTGQLERDLVYQLSRLGNNLNQLARVANSIGEIPTRDDLLDLLDEIRQAVAELR